MVRTQVLKHLPGARKARVEGAKEMSGEERWRRVGVSGSLRGRRLEEITQMLPPCGGRKYLLSPKAGDGN